MSPDELRALAEALDKITPVMGLEELHHMETLDRAADFLRQCAEQRPVAWMSDESAGRLLGGGNGSRGTVPVHCERSRVSAIPLYLHPAPAAPQPADRCRSSETPSSKATSAASPERQALNLEDAAAQVAAGSGEQAEPPRQAGHEISLGALMREQRQSRIVAGAFPDGNPAAKAMIAQTPQAEPKREPLSDAQLASVCLSYRHDFGLLNKDEQARLMLEARDWGRAFRKEWQREPLSDDDINKLAWKQNLWTDHMIEFSFLAFAREVERAHGIGGSDDTK